MRSGARERLAVDAHVVGFADVEGGAVEHLAVDDDAPLGDPGLRVAPRAEPGPRHHLGDALALADPRPGLGIRRPSSLCRSSSAPALPSAGASLMPERSGLTKRVRRQTGAQVALGAEILRGRAAKRRSDERRFRRGARGGGARRGSGRRRDCSRRRVIARAGNRTSRTDDPTAHAEILAIRAAAASSARRGSPIAIST